MALKTKLMENQLFEKTNNSDIKCMGVLLL